jgi:peptide/nickel transport system substrate-binding protein
VAFAHGGRLDTLLNLQGATPAATVGDFDLFVASGADPVSLDPRKTFVGPGYSINAHAFEALAFRRELEDGTVEVYPVLAESWEQIDPTTLQFTLRQGVKFHNGEDFNADAVVFTITTIQDPDFTTSLKTWTNDIESVEAIDEYTVQIKTPTEIRGLVNSLVQIPIVAPGAAEELGEAFDREPVGTGPYRIASYEPNSAVVMERFEDYWGDPGQAATITFRILPENATRLAALQAGEVDIAEALPPDKLEEVEADENLSVVSSPTLRVDFLVPHHERPIMQNRDFREAMSLAIDRQAIVDSLLSGTTEPANSISPPGTIGYDAEAPVYEYDPDRAKELLEASGYNGEEVFMGGPSGRYVMDRQVTEAIAAMLQDVGINIKLEVVEWSAFRAKTAEDAYDLYFIGITDFTLNPVSHWGMFHTGESEDYGSYSNPEMDAIIEEAAKTLDDEAASELFLRGQRLQREEYGAIPLYYEPQLIGVNQRVQGFVPRLDEYVIVRDVTKSPES